MLCIYCWSRKSEKIWRRNWDHGYKDNIDDISRQIDDDRKIRARKNVYALKGWIGDDVSDDDIDDILEFLEDMRLLNDDGKMLRKEFWKKYIKKWNYDDVYELQSVLRFILVEIQNGLCTR